MSKELIIGLSGKIGSGKTTFAEFLKEELETIGIVTKILNFADALKKITFELSGHHGYTQEDKQVYLEDWGMTVGTMLQRLGTEVMRTNFDEDVWVKATFSKLIPGVNIIGDCRFPNEAEAIKKRGGLLIRLDGDPAEVRKNSTRDLTHASETSLDNYNEFDYVFLNTGTLEDLKTFVNEVVNRLLDDHFQEDTRLLNLNL